MLEMSAYLILFIAFAFVCEWLYRKTKARVQHRYGPLHTGTAGLLQPLADFLKLLGKEDISRGNIIFDFAPVALLTISFFSIFLIPVGGAYSLNFGGDIILLVFLFDIYALSQLLLGEFSKSTFSHIGALRQVLLFASFEVPFILAIAAFALNSKTLSLAGMQGFSPWLLIPFAVFLIAALGKTRKLPFDIGIAEQEIVAGYETELSGRKLALLRLADNIELLFVAALAATLLFGPAGSLILLLVESLAVVFILSFISALFPRYRIDQATKMYWRFLFPLALISVVICFF